MEPDKAGAKKPTAKPQTPLTAVKPGELPSVLRTTTDFASKSAAGPGATAGASTAGKDDAAKQAGSRSGHLVSTDVASTALLPRLDPAAHHQALPARPAKPASPPRPSRGSPTPERTRGSKQPDALRSSSDSPLAAAAATAAGSPGALQPTTAGGAPGRRTTAANMGSRSPDVGSVAMSALPASFYRKLTAEGDSSKSLSPTHNRPAVVSPAALAAAATAASPQSADDIRLLRPVDPSKPGYYWKPVQGEAAAAAVKEAMGPAANADNVLGYQLLQEVAGPEPLSAPIAHTRQRKSMLMRLPLGTEHFVDAVPAAIQDKAGHACLMVLPSDKPSNRKEAMAAEAFLTELLKDPDTAVQRACQWRAAVLAEMCNDSLGVVADALKQRGPPSSWQFRQLNRNLTGQMLGSGMVEALEGFISDSSSNPTAEKMVSLLNSKEATAQFAAAAAVAKAAASAAVAPASHRIAYPVGTGAAAAAMNELAETVAAAQHHQEQLQRGLQQQVADSMNRHQHQLLQVHQLESPRGQQQQLPQTPGTHRSSRMGSAVDPDSAASSPHMQQQPFAGLQSPASSPSRHSTALRRSALQHASASPGSAGSPSSPAAVAARPPAADSSLPSEAAADAGSSSSRSSLSRGKPGYEGLQVSTDSQSLGHRSSATGNAQQQHPGSARSQQNGSTSPKRATAALADSAELQLEQQQQPEQQQQQGLATPGKSRLSTATTRKASNLQPDSGTSASPRRSPPVSPSRAAGSSSQAGSPGHLDEEQTGGDAFEAVEQQGHSAAGDQAEQQHQQQQGQDLTTLYGLALGASVCMADLIRQVEVACVERGRALTYAWNCSVGAAETAMVELRGQNRQLLGINSTLAQDMQTISKELKGLDFVRREAVRFRKELEDTNIQLSTATADNARLKGRLEVAEAQMDAIEKFCCKRLARLRWRNAFAVLGTWSRQSTVQSGGHKRGAGQLLAKVMMLEKLAHAVDSVERRKMAYGRNQAKDKFDYNRPQMSDMVQVMTLGPQVAAPGRIHDGYNIDSTVQMLTALTPEARTMVLATMPAVQRWKVLEAMRDEERAAMVIAMSVGLRKEASEAVDVRLWERTIDIIRNHSGFASRYLTGMDIDDAAAEFQTWGVYQKVDTLGALDTYTAAALLTRTKEVERRELLGMLEPYLAANIVQAMMPPPAASAVDALDVKKGMAILMAMDPNKAADVLTEMGASKAAGKLVGMDADARNSIIEMMAPRDAAQTLTKMEDVIQQAQEEEERTGTRSPELLSLTGASNNLESPVMGTMTELNARDAFNILSYMSVQDKAALLANMEPTAVARLLGLMDPQEAVLLLNALGDSHDKLVSQALSIEERDRLVEVLQAADCKPSSDFSRRARKKGSFRKRPSETEKVERLVDAYQTIEAGAMDEDAADEAATSRSSKSTASNKPANKPAPPKRPATKSIGIQVGGGPDTGANIGGSSAAAAEPRAAAAAGADSTSGSGDRHTRSRSPTTSSTGFAGDAHAADADAAAAAVPSKAPSNKVAKPTAKPAEAKKQPVNAKKPEERKTSFNGALDSSGESDTSDPAAAAGTAAPAVPSGEATAKKPTTAAAAAKPAAAAKSAATVGANKGRKTRPSDTDESTAAAAAGKQSEEGRQQGSLGGASSGEGAVPPLVLGSHSELEDDAGSPPSTSRKVRYIEDDSTFDGDTASASSTPRATGTGAATSRNTARAPKTPAAAAASAAAGRKALKEALKSQAAGKKLRPSNIGVAGGGGGSIGAILKEASQFVPAADDDSGVDTPSTLTATTPAASEAPPQQRLGKVPKNARLIEAMAQHKNAKPKPKGWLMAVVDSIYKEGETLLRKLGRADMIKKQSVPEIVFAFFHNKYGQRALVNENVGSLVNTLTLYQRNDLRLEAFARLLSEEWDVSIFLDFLNAQNMCMQPAKMACVEYPREASKDEQYPWLDLYKAVWVADSILGMRAQAARDRFNEFLHMASIPADDADVERLRRERREAAAKDPTARQQQEELPESFFKLPRIRFLLILCKEICRINKFITTFGEDKFTAMDVNRTDKVDIVLVRSFVKAMSPGASDAQVSDNINTFVSTAEGAARDVPPEQVSVPSVTELTRDAFVLGVSITQFVREHIKLHLLHAARLEEDDNEAQVFFNLLSVLMMRHSAALLPTWQAAVEAAGDRGRALQQQLAAVTTTGTSGDARLKAYVSLLLALMNTATQDYLNSLLSNDVDVESLESDQMEDGLVRLEDAALILLGRCGYLVDDSNQDLASARMSRLPLNSHIKVLGQQLVRHRKMKEGMVASAALVMQRIWLRRKRLREQ